MIDAVLCHHISPYGCGTAKWSAHLARELGVPLLTLDRHPVTHPLLSLRECESYVEWEDVAEFYPRYDLFVHDAASIHWRGNPAILAAHRVYAANGVIARRLREFRPDVIEAWCPSTIETPPPRAALTILTFGMAHKLVSPHYQRLKALLEAHGEPYTILLSTGVHEGTPWDEALESAAASLRGIFGAECVEVLGYLSDAALDREIRAATACAAFYDPALRANNTTAWAVLERWKPLVTNLDSDSPDCNALDVRAIQHWGDTFRFLPCVIPSWSGKRGLIDLLRAEVPCVS